MASFRIHEDQENRGIPELRQKQANMAPVQQKRAILGALDNQRDRQNKQKGKQPLGISKVQVGGENTLLKQVSQKQPLPVVPVAQFEAFKVYEDSKENEIPVNRNHNKPLAISKTVKVESANIKKEWFTQESKAKHEPENKLKQQLNIVHKQDDWEKKYKEEELKTTSAVQEPEFDDVIPGTPPDLEAPMSIEKSLEEESTKLVLKSKSTKDMFFENEEYRSEIYLYLREHELHNRPKPGYMRKQPDITYNMRTILVDWLVEVAEEYKLQTETLYLAINYIDRFLSYMSVVRGKLQLVGTAAMFIAAKYEEIYPPDVKEFVYITDDTYTKKQVIRMEHLILKVLSFDLSVPTPLTFITAMSITTRMPEKVMYLAMYLSELSMLETDPYLETIPSVLAAAAIAVSRYTFKLEAWTAELKRKTGYDAKDLRKSMEFLYILFCKAPAQAQQAIQEKYNSFKYLHVSKLHPRSEDIKHIE